MPLSPELVDRFRDHLTGWSHRGIAVRHDYESGSAELGLITVTWRLVYAGEDIGTVQRSLSLAPDGTSVHVRHDDLSLWTTRRPSRLHGVGRRLFEYELEQWRALGLTHLRLRAHGVGSYLWATYDFAFAVEHRPADDDEASAAAGQALLRPQAMTELSKWERIREDLVEKFLLRVRQPGEPHRAGHFRRPRDIVQFSVDPSAAAFVRSVMTSTAWDGIYLLL